MSGKTSGYFACETGVRQGENLSPLLFSILLFDLRDYLSTKYNGLSFINNNISDLLNDINLDTYLKLYVLLYADDTVILAESKRIAASPGCNGSILYTIEAQKLMYPKQKC